MNRSLSVRGVEQELRRISLAYNHLRLEMERIADETELDPVRISFVTALRLIRDEAARRRPHMRVAVAVSTRSALWQPAL